jgi:O-antigen/teichoic acid export membrane protein
VRVISLVRFFVLAKLLTPGDFGLLAIAAIAVEMLLALTDLGLIPSLIQHRDPDRRLYDIAWTLEVIRAFAVASILFVGASLVAQIFAEPRAAPVLRGLTLATLIASLGSVRSADFSRDLRFAPLAALDLAAAVVEAIVSIALARTLGVWALVVGQITSATVHTGLTWVLAPYRPRLVWNLAAARPLLAFGRWMWVTVVAYTLGDLFLRAVVSRRLGTVDLGLYYVALRLATIPKQVMTDLIAPVVFPVYARLQDTPLEAARVYRSTILAMAAVLLPAYTALGVLSTSLVTILLGAQWAGSREVLVLLSVAACISLVMECTVPLVTGLGHPHTAALMSGARSALVVGFAWALAGTRGIDGVAAAWVVAEAGVLAVALTAARRTTPETLARLAVPLTAIALVAGASAVVARVVDGHLRGPLGVLIAVLTAASTVIVLLAVLDRALHLGFAAAVRLVSPGFGGLRPWLPTRGTDV